MTDVAAGSVLLVEVPCTTTKSIASVMRRKWCI